MQGSALFLFLLVSVGAPSTYAQKAPGTDLAAAPPAQTQQADSGKSRKSALARSASSRQDKIASAPSRAQP